MLCLEIPKEIYHESFRDEDTGSLCKFRPRILSIGALLRLVYSKTALIRQEICLRPESGGR